MMDAEAEKRFGVSVEGERDSRAYMSGPELGIHPLANGGGKGMKLELREVDIKPVESVGSVFVWVYLKPLIMPSKQAMYVLVNTKRTELDNKIT